MSDESPSSVSARKLRANRRNAQKSTGPKTEEGKRASSGNALIHGLYCSKDFILPGESEAKFLFLRQNHIRSLLPMNSIELSLVERVARNDWKIKRVHQMQHELYCLQMQRSAAQAEVLASSIKHPAQLFTPEEEDNLSTFEQEYLDRIFSGDAKARQRRKKFMVESISQAMIPQQTVRAMQFGREGEFDRYAQLEKLEQQYENGMDKALRQLERLRKSKAMNHSEEDEMEQTLLCPYLEEYADITAVLEEEKAEKRAFVEEIGRDEEDEANEASEEEVDDKSNGEKDLAADGARMDTDKRQEEEPDDRDMDFQSMREASERAGNRGLDGQSTD